PAPCPGCRPCRFYRMSATRLSCRCAFRGMRGDIVLPCAANSANEQKEKKSNQRADSVGHPVGELGGPTRHATLVYLVQQTVEQADQDSDDEGYPLTYGAEGEEEAEDEVGEEMGHLVEA